MKIITLMENSSSDPELFCEHGLSLYIETGEHKILFDSGQSDRFADNAEKLGVDLTKVDFAVLSHGHYDHSGGLRRFMQINATAPVYVNRNAFDPYFNAAGKFIGINLNGIDTSRIRFADDRLEIGEGICLYSCNDHTPITAIDSFGQTRLENEKRISDDYRHEQYLLIHECGKRICFSGCSHKGIRNIVHWLQPDVLVGGFHYMKVPTTGEGRDFLLESALELLRTDAVYYTGHCTGEAQYDVMKSAMGDRLQILSSGVKIEL